TEHRAGVHLRRLELDSEAGALSGRQGQSKRLADGESVFRAGCENGVGEIELILARIAHHYRVCCSLADNNIAEIDRRFDLENRLSGNVIIGNRKNSRVLSELRPARCVGEEQIQGLVPFYLAVIDNWHCEALRRLAASEDECAGTLYVVG